MSARHLKICHTADWHLGHTLHGHGRDYEHERFLAFLADSLEQEACDALIVAGDVFDTANPPASAQALFFFFLAEVRRRLPRLDVLIVAGNHDSAARLSAPGPVLRALGVHIVGNVPRAGSSGRAPVDPESLLVPLRDRGGEIAAWVAAVPFLRPSDLPVLDEGDALIEGVRAVYDTVLDAARARLRKGQALLATGHCHMVQARASELSERRILGGLSHALPIDLFPADVAYVALGHLHFPQAVGDAEHVRYSGSPIPLSMPEEGYPHQVRIVRFEDGELAGQRELRIPRAVEVLRIPREGPQELEAVLAQLAQLDLPTPSDARAHPFLEVRVRLSEPVLDLRQRIEGALGGRPARLVKITIELAGSEKPLPELEQRRDLADLTLDDVFARCYDRKYGGEPALELVAAFHEVVDAARRAEDAS